MNRGVPMIEKDVVVRFLTRCNSYAEESIKRKKREGKLTKSVYGNLTSSSINTPLRKSLMAPLTSGFKLNCNMANLPLSNSQTWLTKKKANGSLLFSLLGQFPSLQQNNRTKRSIYPQYLPACMFQHLRHISSLHFQNTETAR